MIPIRLSRIIFLLIFLAVLLLNHYYISKTVDDDDQLISSNVRLTGKRLSSHPSYTLDDLDAVSRADDLSYRIKEMIRIKGSVSNELKNLESRKQKLQNDISSLSNQMIEIEYRLSKKQSDLNRLYLSIGQAEFTLKETSSVNQPFLSRPIKLLPLSRPQDYSINENANNQLINGCSMSSCFDYSRCSLTSGFPIYIYSSIIESQSTGRLSSDNLHDLVNQFKRNHHNTLDGNIACVYIVLINPQSNLDIENIQSTLHSLDYWSGDGRNHLIINLNQNVDIIDYGIKSFRALVLQSNFNGNHLREDFDVIIPSLTINNNNHLISSSKIPNCPARRKYLITYQGSLNQSTSNDGQYRQLFEIMTSITNSSTNDEILFNFNCANTNCTSFFTQSTFSIVLPPLNTLNQRGYKSHPVLIDETLELLSFGVIPVLIGGNDYKLPFHEIIDWKKIVLHLPLARMPEIHLIVKSFSDSDIIDMRRQGKLIYDRYFSTIDSRINSLISFVRHQRLNIPALPVVENTLPFLFNSTYSSNKYLYAFENPESIGGNQETEIDRNLGPIESPFPSITFQRNFSLTLCHGYSLWNSPQLNPFILYPNTPFDPVLPSEAKFTGSGYGFRPIGQGAGGTGKEFSEALGGNWPKEQFTIVMLTYERETILIKSLERLLGLPYLNKVLVIWNSPRKPSDDVKWPDLGVPINVIEADQNSLNNRFKPYSQIETEAILSMDDDVHLRHDEIIFGFRVWREARDRVVGFPGRYHAWDNNFNSWLYNSNYTCELSMVLTGAAFFHKYYTYMYTHSMDKAIREKVDELMNCEDIAMNFLVSHITRQPPLKVTSRWTFKCVGCPVRLSEDDSHFQERHKCINYFTSLYGYNPLLQTQFRADSILFKTRIPHDKTKCFKFL
ncbi:exostosin-3-like [Panonychus citri]|uniref:exostosin-3-like n=1 Tax=Panonychus citri TaxID=50023 RepID=UPI0023072965|nr:exostosin-3-like [Panonychus citri]XP_053211602.1 exostosin-3-like [Panonychus citri]